MVIVIIYLFTKKNKQFEYIEEIKSLINNLENKEKLITKLNEFIKIGIILNDINNNENLIIKNE